MHNRETIAAIATASGSAGVGIVRISGSLAYDIGSKIVQTKIKTRYAHYADFVDSSGQLIDKGIALYFKAPHSFTGEDVFELQAHGGTALLNMLLQQCIDYGARRANAGEFSERAYLNDKLSLDQAEAVAALISASSSAQVRAASRALAGEFKCLVDSFLKNLINVRSHIEAALDFPDEDIDFLQDAILLSKMQDLQNEIAAILKNARTGQLLQEGMQIVILGVPNAGKSSLLNALAGVEQAIVTDVAGTTRDVIASQINLDGMPVNIIDTAGLRETSDHIEAQGIQRAWQAVAKADKVLLIVDSKKGIGTHEQAILAKLPQGLSVDFIYNKIDLYGIAAQCERREQANHIYLSTKTRQGLDLLIAALQQAVGYKPNTEGAFSVRERHISALQQVQQDCKLAAQNLQVGAGELAAAELYHAQNHLAELTGKFENEQLLGNIFSHFCIGK